MPNNKLKGLNVNEAQSKAISHGEGPMLVLAGPGSGKTLVITQRIRYLIEEYKVEPGQILVITFTKAAALEMQTRFLKLSGDKFYPVNFGTFHAIFFQILKQTYHFDAKSILRENEKHQILREILKTIPEELKSSDGCCSEQNNHDQAGKISEDSSSNDSSMPHLSGMTEETDEENSLDTRQRILSEISKIKNTGTIIQKYESEVCGKEEFIYIYEEYRKVTKSLRKVDFDDMMLLCKELLINRPNVLAAWQKRFSYILIDEFQDINPIQYEIIQMLSKPQDNLFVVGDDDQAIYGFRGSRPEIMLHFKDDYPNAEQVLLNINYRSKKDIVEASKRLICNNKTRFAKEVKTANTTADGVSIYSFESRAQENQNIISLIEQYMKIPGSNYRDIAILYRTNTNAGTVAEKLMQAGIPFQMKEKIKSPYESSIAKDIIAYLRYAINENDVKDFFRIMNKPVRYIRRDSVPLQKFSMQELIRNNADKNYVIQNIIQMYDKLHFIKQMSPYAAVNYIRRGVGYDDYLIKEAKKNKRSSDEVLKELDVLLQCAREFDTINEWLTYIENYDEKLEEAKNTNEDAVQIVTMHASKGLEWPIVIIPDINEGVVPHKKAVSEAEIEEERRMFFVAMTRAKDKLFLFYVKEQGKEKEAGNILPSRFIYEIYS